MPRALRDSLHRLVDDLPETEVGRAERLLQVLKETAEPPLYTLENAPEGHVSTIIQISPRPIT
jgi:hypothetical protein